MKHFWSVFRFELTRQGTRRAYLFTTFGVPLIAIVLLLGYQFIRESQANQPEEPAQEDPAAEEMDNAGPVGYVDDTGLFGDPGLYSAFLIPYDSEEEARAAIDAGEIESIYVIEEDYLETGNVTWYSPSSGIRGFNVMSVFTNFLMQGLLDGTDRSLLYRLQDPINLTEHHVTTGGEVNEARSEGGSFILVYLFAFVLMFGAFVTSGYLMQSVIEEKETRVVEILLSSVRPTYLLAGKVLAMGLLGLLQMLVWFGAAAFLLARAGTLVPELANANIRPDAMIWTLVYFVFGYLFFAGVYAAIGAISPSMREGPQWAAFITLPAALPFYFSSTVFVEAPNGTLATVLSLFPITAPLSMVQRLAITQVPLIELLISVVLLALTSAFTIWLAGRFFRVNALLAGQMPKLRDLVQIVRER